MSAELALGSEPAALRAEVLRSVEQKPDAGYGLYHLISAWGQLACAIVVFLLMPEGWGYKLAFFFIRWRSGFAKRDSPAQYHRQQQSNRQG